MRQLLLIVLITLQVTANTAKAQKVEDDIFAIPKTYAVQKRKYNLANQMSAVLGYMPMDSFEKGVVVGLSYTNYFSDFTGWEIVNANYVFGMDTGLKDDLKNNFAADPGLLPEFPQWYITTNLVYTPIYNKNLFFNKSIIWGDISFVGGGGVGSFKRDDFKASTKPLVDIGVMLRFFYTDSSSIKVDVRENLPFLSDGVEPFLMIGIAYTYQFGSNKNKEGFSELEKQFE